jgi:signal peptidase
MKKIFSVFFRVMLASAAVLIVLYAAIASISDVNPGIKAYAVASGSMSPVIPKGSLILAKKTNPETLRQGEVITFLVDANLDGRKEVVTHYFDGYVTQNGITYLATRSEIGGKRDLWLVEASDLRGVCILSVPEIGKIALFAAHPIGMICLALDGLILFTAFWLISEIESVEAYTIPGYVL